MKRNIVLSVIVIIVGIGALLGFLYIQSLHKVSLAFDPEVKGVTIYRQEGNEVKKLSAPGNVSLQNGSYYIIPSGNKLSQAHIGFTVKDKDVQMTIDPDYGTEVLSVAMINEKAKIENTAKTAFPLINEQYILQSETLMHRGEWFGALLTQKDDTRNELDYYRIILHKESSVWKVVGSPALVLTKSEFKNVPANVIDSVNKLVQ